MTLEEKNYVQHSAHIARLGRGLGRSPHPELAHHSAMERVARRLRASLHGE
jgi:hypothetical protein